jgi:L-fuconolactonase
MIIDAHHHFWRLDRGDYGWLGPTLPALNRDFLPGHLHDALAACNVRATVLVQAAPTESETLFLLDLAEHHEFIAGVVGWTDFASTNAPSRIRELAARGGGRLKGFRPMIQDVADTAWIASPSLDPAFDTLAAEGLTFDALVRPVHLEGLLRRLERSSGVPVVIDHCGKPRIKAGGFSAWADAIERIARYPHVWCKLSGLVTEPGAGRRAQDLEPIVRHVFQSFGPDRVLWGSDWPVLNLASDYATWFETARELVRQFAPQHAVRVFGGAAIEFYRLDVEDVGRVPARGRPA